MKIKFVLSLAVCLIGMMSLAAVSQDGGGQSTAEKANQAYQDQDWEKAAAAYKALTAEDPSNAQAWFRLGRSYYSLNKHQDAATSSE